MSAVVLDFYLAPRSYWWESNCSSLTLSVERSSVLLLGPNEIDFRPQHPSPPPPPIPVFCLHPAVLTGFETVKTKGSNPQHDSALFVRMDVLFCEHTKSKETEKIPKGIDLKEFS